jgi:1,4-alpha-glucan branching enzyme
VLTDYDIYLFKQGNHFRLYDRLGAHLGVENGVRGARFAVWAPGAQRVSVIGDFNAWNPDAAPLSARPDASGIWEGFVAGVDAGAVYKYRIESGHLPYAVEKADPFAFRTEPPPRTASIVWDLAYEWGDGEWMATRPRANDLSAPMSIYEVHLGSWRRVPEAGNRSLTYRELARDLTQYVVEMGFTHVEFLPVMEHPFYGSWGYQVTGYFAPTTRYGTPQDLMYLIDQLHRHGIGVILDWVPSHFPSDEHGLVFFDGSHLYEHADPRQGFHPEWKSCIFNYGRHEVRAFLGSSAAFWLDAYHADGLRVDAVASMLYLDYARAAGEWIPNEFGGRENLPAISFLRDMNRILYRDHPGTQTIAEESTAWPMVSRPTDVGGLGFGLKWNMGWMHDTLDYFSRDSLYRKYHQNQITFGVWYAFTENFVLPLSHDEVVYGKGSLIQRMPGDDWQKRANLRLLLGYLYAHPGKKLLFMGGEFGQTDEWHHEKSLDWRLLESPAHQGIQKWSKDLNAVYRRTGALYERDFDADGFEWVDNRDWENSLISFLRKGRDRDDVLLVVCNFTPEPRTQYRVGVPRAGFWREVLNSDAREYGGSGLGSLGGVQSEAVPANNRAESVSLTLPPLAIVYFRHGPAHFQGPRRATERGGE